MTTGQKEKKIAAYPSLRHPTETTEATATAGGAANTRGWTLDPFRQLNLEPSKAQTPSSQQHTCTSNCLNERRVNGGKAKLTGLSPVATDQFSKTQLSIFKCRQRCISYQNQMQFDI